MLGSLYSDRPITVSPALAATIGLEEAVMVHVLAELLTFRSPQRLDSHPDLNFVLLGEADMGRFFPFWKARDIDRIRLRLMQLDMLVYEPHSSEQGAAWYALQRMDRARRQPSTVRRRQSTTGPIPPDWQPDREWISQCRQQDIPEDFVHAQVPRFVLYWRERGEARFSWGTEFCKHVLKEWREEQTAAGDHEKLTAMSTDWQPKLDALEILLRAGVNRNFIEDAIPEFVLYWKDTGKKMATWNSRFVDHVQRQWRRFQSAGMFGREPRPIEEDWQPDAACLEIVQLAQIDEEWALSQTPEFVLYWRETNEARESWNTIFLQRIKQLWAQRLKQQEIEESDAGNQVPAGAIGQEDQAWRQRITDRSWAE